MTHPTDALRLVPVEPTLEMLDAGSAVFSGGKKALDYEISNAASVYEAMTSAAPASPLPGGGDMERDEIARLVWQRFAPSSDMDEANALRGGYVLVANDIVALRKLPAAPTGAK